MNCDYNDLPLTLRVTERGHANLAKVRGWNYNLAR